MSTVFSASKPPADHAHNHKTTISKELLESAQAAIAAVLQRRLHTESAPETPSNKDKVIEIKREK